MNHLEEYRLGKREPRSLLLPPYLQLDEYYKEFMEALDHVWKGNVDEKIEVIQHLRHMWVTNPGVEQKILDGEPIDIEDWSWPERQLLVKQVNLLGMKLKSAGLLTDLNYLTISRYVGIYWFGKGTKAFIEFINFALVADLEVRLLWSTVNEDEFSHVSNGKYNNMQQENEDGTPPGTPIWEGGTWFRTTHVDIVSYGFLKDMNATTLAEFFYEIANYNLVLNAIDYILDIDVVDREEHSVAEVVAHALYLDHQTVISNF